MATIRNPHSFSEIFGVEASQLATLGVLDPVLNVDTNLFIDPLLLSKSKHQEISTGAVSTYRTSFDLIIRLLAGSKRIDDVAWKAARQRLTFPEIQATCLGYGAASIAGRSWGRAIRERVLQAAKEIVELGVTDPDLFMVVALLEDGVGPDLISDMTTNIILPDLVKFTERVTALLKIETESFQLTEELQANLPRNPLLSGSPVILVPLDILKELPIASSWSDVADAAAKNSALRGRVNKLIGAIWKSRVIKNKATIRAATYANRAAFDAMLEAIRNVPKTAYDSTGDPEGHFAWVRLHHTIAQSFPLVLSLATKPTLDDVSTVVKKIIDHYQDLIENKGIWKEFWDGNSPRPEKSAQRIFFAIADAYCKANDLDISPEADSGVGPVDFKISSGYAGRVLVEVKLSTNSKVVAGYEKQLAAYKKAESTTRATYLLIDIGGMGNKAKRILAIKNNAAKHGQPVSEVVIVNGKKQKSASKRA